MMRAIRLAIEITCHLGALFVLSGVAALAYVAARGACPRFDTGMISCTSPFDKSVADYAMGVTLVSVFTGLPLLLFFGSIGFILWRMLRRRDARKKAERQNPANA